MSIDRCELTDHLYFVRREGFEGAPGAFLKTRSRPAQRCGQQWLSRYGHVSTRGQRWLSRKRKALLSQLERDGVDIEQLRGAAV